MIKKITYTIFLIAFSAASAETPKNSEKEKDTKSFCYYQDKKFSEGAVLNDQICVRPVKTKEEMASGEEISRDLIWKKASPNVF